MRILVTSDWHGDAVTAGLRRIQDVEEAARRTVEIAVEREVDTYVYLGDLADPDCGSILVRVMAMAINVAKMLASFKIANHWVAGNHDVIEDGSGLSTLHPLDHLTPYTRVHEKPAIMSDLQTEIVFLPFVSRTALYDPAEYLRANPLRVGTRRLVMGHCTGLANVEVGSESRDMARGAELPFPLEECRRQGVAFMANGHFHKHQVTPDGVHIPGALGRLRFDEEGNSPGVFVVEVAA